MNWTKQTCALALASAVGFGAVAAAPATAAPAPYTPSPTTTVTTTNPPVGGTVGMSGRNFQPREQLVIRIKSKPRTLQRLQANRKGRFSTSIKLPKRYKCQHTLIVRGKQSGKVTRTTIFIGKRSACR